jgi:membrane-associated phospholipid phosphatase
LHRELASHHRNFSTARIPARRVCALRTSSTILSSNDYFLGLRVEDLDRYLLRLAAMSPWTSALGILGASLVLSSGASAQEATGDEPPIDAGAPAQSSEPSSTEGVAATTPPVALPDSRQREVSLEPRPAEPVVRGRTTFDIDPIADGGIIGISFGFAFVLNQIKSTGEIRAQQIAPDFDRSSLLAIDRAAVTAEHHPSARTWSNVGSTAAIVFAGLDPLLSAYREESLQTGLVDFVLYAETLALTQATTNLVKLAVRRPRPAAYLEAEANRDNPNYSNTETDSALSFFSGHASTTASIGATATYLAFARSPSSWRPWATLVGATALTTFVSVQRVRAGAHFPTDVIAGAIAGAGIGVIVPHLHRTEDIKQRRVWVGFAPTRHERLQTGGVLTLGGVY